jgi:HSP20 family protein
MATLIRWNPAYSVRPWRYVGPRHFWRTVPHWDTSVAMPIDIEEKEDHYLIKASVPGFTPDDLKIEVEDGVLVIRAEREADEEQEENGWYLRERYAGRLERRLRLGNDIDAENIEAELEHGVLTLTLSKVEEAKPKLIEVKAG